MGSVVDASICIKWFFDEEHHEAAKRLLGDDTELSAPDLIVAEFGNVVWKKLKRGEITSFEGARAVDAFNSAQITLVPARDLATVAFKIAADLGHPFYDCLYLALAQRERTRVVTADKRLRNKLAGTPYAALLLWIEDVP